MVVPPAVDLDHETSAVMHEVGDITPDRRLAANVKVQRSEGFPKNPLGGRHIFPKTPGALDGARRMSRSRRFSGHAVTPIPNPFPHQRGKGEHKGNPVLYQSPNSARGIRPTSEPVRQVARKPAIIAFQTRLRTSWRRWGTRTEKPATFMPTEPILAKPHSA